MICAAALTLLYYYDATAPVFTHDDPVPWGRSVLGRQGVVMVCTITTLVHGWTLMCLPLLLFPTSVFVCRLFAMLSILVCVWATTHVLAEYASVVYGLSYLLPSLSSVRSVFVGFQLLVRYFFALAEASSMHMPKSLNLACDCFFVFSSTFVFCNCLRMCRKIVRGLWEVSQCHT